MKRNTIKTIIVLVLGFLILSTSLVMGFEDTDVIGRMTKTIRDADGEVTLTLDWLRRPGEFALTIDYYGYLTQEGMVNAFLSVNQTNREFITLREELPNRHQRIRILSFHPTTGKKGPKSLKKLAPVEMVDYPLFLNAPYYPTFGTVNIEVKFFANSRWDGDSQRGNGNYQVTFASPVKEAANDHF